MTRPTRAQSAGLPRGERMMSGVYTIGAARSRADWHRMEHAARRPSSAALCRAHAMQALLVAFLLAHWLTRQELRLRLVLIAAVSYAGTLRDAVDTGAAWSSARRGGRHAITQLGAWAVGAALAAGVVLFSGADSARHSAAIRGLVMTAELIFSSRTLAAGFFLRCGLPGHDIRHPATVREHRKKNPAEHGQDVRDREDQFGRHHETSDRSGMSRGVSAAE